MYALIPIANIVYFLVIFVSYKPMQTIDPDLHSLCQLICLVRMPTAL